MTFRDHLDECMKDPEFRREYDALAPEYEFLYALIEARKAEGFSQQKLAELSGVTQADICRIESGKRNPSIRVLQRLANAMGMTFKLVPIEEVK